MFSVLFSTWGRLGFFRLGAPGRRGFAGGLDAPFEPTPSPDGLRPAAAGQRQLRRPARHAALDDAQPQPQPRRARPRAASSSCSTPACSSVLALVVFAVFGAFAARGGARGRRRRRASSRRCPDLLPSMVPIAFGYLIAHNLRYVVVNSAAAVPAASATRPGSTAGRSTSPTRSTTTSSPTSTSCRARSTGTQPVVVIVAVHIFAVVIAHRHLTLRSRARADARRGEYRWLVAMVAYTMLSLWLVAQPLAKEEQLVRARRSLPAAASRRGLRGVR